jgi:hypothetical protein
LNVHLILYIIIKKGSATIAGGHGTMWTTILQIGELVDTAQKVSNVYLFIYFICKKVYKIFYVMNPGVRSNRNKGPCHTW